MLPYSKVFVLMLLPLGVALQHGRPVPPDQARGRCPIQQVRDGACIDSSPEPFFEEVQPQESWKFISAQFFLPIFANLFEES